MVKQNETVFNDGILDGFRVLEDFEVEYNSQTLPKEDAENLDKEWQELYKKKLVKCTNKGDEYAKLKFKKGDEILFDETTMSKGLVMEILKNHKDKIEEIY